MRRDREKQGEIWRERRGTRIERERDKERKGDTRSDRDDMGR